MGDARHETAVIELRRRAARALAAASAEELAARWAAWPQPPQVQYLRAPEAGQVMVQARIGGAGDRFHLGEATVTRATVLLRGGGLTAEAVGTSYVLGSDPEHAGLAAIFDALVTDEVLRERALGEVIEPLERALAAADAAAQADARSTVVDFLTVSREH